MRLPETDNPHYQHAFKRGYRLALQSKSLSQMPVDFRNNAKKRHYFEMGWQQANDALALQQKQLGKPNWKNRAIWFTFMVIAGLLTAKLMINNFELSQNQQTLIDDSKDLKGISEHSANASALADEHLRLLDTEQYSDLKATAESFKNLNQAPLAPIQSSAVILEDNRLYSTTSGKEYLFDNQIPKFERQLKHVVQLSSPNEGEVVHRWRYGTQIITEESISINKGMNLIQSNQTMTSSRQGLWYIELLQNNKVIDRQEFYYGSSYETSPKEP